MNKSNEESSDLSSKQSSICSEEYNSEEYNSEENNSENNLENNSEENSEENSENNSEENSKNKVIKLGNIYQIIRNIRNYNWIYYHTIENYIKNNRFIRYFVIFQLYILFGLGIYYSTKKTSLLMSPYLMNNELYSRIRGIHGLREIHNIATN